jgi:hypothetical protein
MSAEHIHTTDADGAQSPPQPSDVCRFPNCWRDGSPVRVADETERPAILCDEHRRVFLGVSS